MSDQEKYEIFLRRIIHIRLPEDSFKAKLDKLIQVLEGPEDTQITIL